MSQAATNPAGYLMIALLVISIILMVAAVILDYVNIGDKVETIATVVFWCGIGLFIIWVILLAVWFATHRL